MTKSGSGDALNVNINIHLPSSLSPARTGSVVLRKIGGDEAGIDDANQKPGSMRFDDVVEISPRARKLIANNTTK